MYVDCRVEFSWKLNHETESEGGNLLNLESKSKGGICFAPNSGPMSIYSGKNFKALQIIIEIDQVKYSGLSQKSNTILVQVIIYTMCDGVREKES